MIAQDVTAPVRRFHAEIYQQGNLSVADEIIADGFAWHAPNLPPGLPPGREGVKTYAGLLRTAYPDIHFTADDTITTEDKVVVRWTATGTQTGMLITLPPTGKSMTVTGIDVYRIVDGQIAELWQNWDQLGMLQQLGVAPMPSQP